MRVANSLLIPDLLQLMLENHFDNPYVNELQYKDGVHYFFNSFIYRIGPKRPRLGILGIHHPNH